MVMVRRARMLALFLCVMLPGVAMAEVVQMWRC